MNLAGQESKCLYSLQKWDAPTASPYDGDWIYWSSRMGVHPETPVRVAKLLQRQQGKCAHCDNYFKDGDSLEVDHIIPKSTGGRDSY